MESKALPAMALPEWEPLQPQFAQRVGPPPLSEFCETEAGSLRGEGQGLGSQCPSSLLLWTGDGL